MSTPNPGTAPTTVLTTKAGTDLATFDDVKMYKRIPKVAPITSVNQALELIGGDTNKLMSLLTAAVQSDVVEAARSSNDGWKVIDENGKETETEYSGQLAHPDAVNPMVLFFAKNNFGFDKPNATADERRAAKEQAREMIKSVPALLDSLKKKSLALAAAGE